MDKEQLSDMASKQEQSDEMTLEQKQSDEMASKQEQSDEMASEQKQSDEITSKQEQSDKMTSKQKQLSDMTSKQKLRWFFDYYALPSIVVIGVLVVLALLIKSVIWPEQVEDIRVLIYSDQVSQDQCTIYEQEIERNTGKTASVLVYQISDPYGAQAFAAKIGTDLIDLVIAPEAEMKLMLENGFLLNYAPVEGSSMYMGIPRTAREGDLLEEVIDYLNEKLVA